MRLSPTQDAALVKMNQWFHDARVGNAPQVFRLFGYAGTGKSTLASRFALNGTVNAQYLTPTGKAAQVLRAKGVTEAKTVHRFLYTPWQNDDTELRLMFEELQKLRDSLGSAFSSDPQVRALQTQIEKERAAVNELHFDVRDREDKPELIVLDECSMVGGKIGQDLLDFGLPILAMGDPGQLPPVNDEPFFSELPGDPDVLLTEIHRTADDSPIPWLAQMVREGKKLPEGVHGGKAFIHSRRESDLSATFDSFDVIICGMNKTRDAVNAAVRRALNLTGELPFGPTDIDNLAAPGEPLVNLDNNHTTEIMNGEIVYALENAKKHNTPAKSKWGGAVFDAFYTLPVRRPDGIEVPIVAWLPSRRPNSRDKLTQWISENDHPLFQAVNVESRGDVNNARERVMKLDFGYCLTCHKMQGSEAPNVTVIDESSVFRDDAKRWLYTAVTRASDKLHVFSRFRSI